MAYISTDQIKEKRNDLKKQFSAKDGWKFSIRREYYSSINVSILKAPIDLRKALKDNAVSRSVNHYYIKDNYSPEIAEILKKITAICMKGNHDNSDAMTDYFDVGWYFDLRIGDWDKPFEFNPIKK